MVDSLPAMHSPASASEPVALPPRPPPFTLDGYLDECRRMTLTELELTLGRADSRARDLYQLMLDYPLRQGKALRPALCIATCRALGGSLERVSRSAAVLELYHNAFLIHDDIEDGSEKRRDRPTLHREHGTAVAINVADAMLASALEPLLDNTRLMGLGPALKVLRIVARMARESAEGQSTELMWITRGAWQLPDRAYLRMVHQKTGWYTFIAPMTVGAIAAGADELTSMRLRRLATSMGIAFQIQDDILNLVGDEAAYGKELRGDLWEGKHTLILIHALRHASDDERRHALHILGKPRPTERSDTYGRLETTERIETTPNDPTQFDTLIEELCKQGELSTRAANRLRQWSIAEHPRPVKTAGDVELLMQLIERANSIEYARQVARRHARRALSELPMAAPWERSSAHYQFLDELVTYIWERDR